MSSNKNDILNYASKIWATANILRGNVTTKESLYPLYMMPFFSLVLLESRLLRSFEETKGVGEDQERYEEMKDMIIYYNPVIIEEGLTLSKIVKNDLLFDSEFKRYLNGYPEEVKTLLGVNNGSDDDNLNISSKIKSLTDKGVLHGWLSQWAEVNLKDYDNSEVATLEEHIKRTWADMSAETAGQQYTPSDIIALISELCKTTNQDLNGLIKIYDPTCGGGNMLFGVEDVYKQMAKEKGIKVATKTFGQEIEGSLYALSKIESYFRIGSYISKGNTLTNDKFSYEKMDLVVANPPYGVDWKEYKKSIDNDATGRYEAGKPTTSDGQLLFVQHIIDKLNDNGNAFVVLNGSPLSSGDAGSGESEIRKWILENDYLRALIQLPTGEFFNTNITTYIWCLSKNKPEELKDKILFINAENNYQSLAKNKGDKSKEVDEDNRILISDIFKNNKETEISKIKSKYDFFFNKQIVKVLKKDEKFGALSEKIKVKINELCMLPYLKTGNFKDLKEEVEFASNYFKEIFSTENDNVLTFKNISGDIFEYHCENNILLVNGDNLGCAQPSLKLKYIPRKVTKKGEQEETVSIDLYFEPLWEKDEEKISYSPFDNEKQILDFIKQWVCEDEEGVQLFKNTIGVKINFNDVFETNKFKIRSVLEILKDLENC